MMKNNLEQWHQKVAQLLGSNALTAPTRKAWQERLEKAKGSNRFFSENAFQLLSLVCDRLMDQEEEERLVNVAVFIDERLADGSSDGWRYDEMPPDGEMLLKGLEGIEETAFSLFGKSFKALQKGEQLKVLTLIQQGAPPGATWQILPAMRFFEELLAEATEIFYSYPLVQVAIGYTGMADAAGWKNIGLNQKEEWETTRQEDFQNL